MAFPWIFANLAAGNQPASKLDDNFNALGKISTIPCTATGTNAYTLAPAAGSPTVTAYNQLQAFRAIIPATSTGAVTAGQAAPGLLACYKPSGAGPVAAGAGDVVIGECYDFVFDMALNSGAGGFHLYNVAGSGGGSGKIIGLYRGTYTANTNLTTAMPTGSTPVAADGTQIISVTGVITGSTTQRVRGWFSGTCGFVAAAGLLAPTVAVFRGTTYVNSESGSSIGGAAGAPVTGNLALIFDDAPGAAGTYVYNFNVGLDTGAAMRMNGSVTTAYSGRTTTVLIEVYEP